MSILADSKRFWPILMANGLYYLFAGMSEAVIAKEVYAVLSPRLISLQSIIGWGGGILLGMAWSRWGKKLFPLLIPMHTAQMLASIAYLIYTEATMNILVYWILGQGMYIFLGGLADKIFDGACATFSWCLGLLTYNISHKSDLELALPSQKFPSSQQKTGDD